MKTLATYNIKGGVGKTSAAVNLAYLAAAGGRRTLLWDLDPQGAATYLYRVRPRVKGGGKGLVRGKRPLEDVVAPTTVDRVHLVPSDFTYRNLDLALDGAKRSTQRISKLLEPLVADYDLVVLDCPPSISLVSENVLHAADGVLVPLIPTTLSVRTLDQLSTFIEELDGKRPRVLGFFSMVDRRKRLHRDIVERLPAERSDIAATTIPALSVIEQMTVKRAPVPAFAPRSDATRRYRELWEEVVERGL
ncbi:MAG: ParA family protein [bacterium]|nr:ParA family protein [bacterium]